MAGWFDRLLAGLRGGSPARRVATGLAPRLGVTPSGDGSTAHLTGRLGRHPCRITLDGDRMAATLRVQAGDRCWSMAWVAPGEPAAGRHHLSEAVAVPADDAPWLERLPLSVRLHAIEVVEAGRGLLRYDPGSLHLHVRAAGLERANAVEQAEIRLDVLEQVAAALPRLESGR